MASASAIRFQIESALARKIPSALTPAARIIRPGAPTGIETLDNLLEGGLPLGAVTELVGPECSGRTSVALSFLARMTQAAKVCAWIDVSNALDPASAAAAGVDLARLLWVRCGVARQSAPQASRNFALPQRYLVPPAAKRGLHGGGFGPHPRGEAKGLSEAVSGLLHRDASPAAVARNYTPRCAPAWAPRCAEPQRRLPAIPEAFEPAHPQPVQIVPRAKRSPKPWPRMEQALRATDLLLQGGGFSAIVLDMGSLPPEAVARVPLATWFRYRAAAERARSSIVLLTQHACAKSSAELLLRLAPGEALSEATVFTGMRYCAEIERRRFTEAPAKVVPLRRPPQRASAASELNGANWCSRTAWAGCR